MGQSVATWPAEKLFLIFSRKFYFFRSFAPLNPADLEENKILAILRLNFLILHFPTPALFGSNQAFLLFRAFFPPHASDIFPAQKSSANNPRRHSRQWWLRYF